MSLVCWRDGCTEGDLLVAVGGVHVELVVVDANLVIWVTRRDSNLEVGGEGVWRRDVEGVNGGVLEDEPWLGRAEDGPDEEYGDQDYEDED